MLLNCRTEKSLIRFFFSTRRSQCRRASPLNTSVHVIKYLIIYSTSYDVVKSYYRLDLSMMEVPAYHNDTTCSSIGCIGFPAGFEEFKLSLSRFSMKTNNIILCRLLYENTFFIRKLFS